MPAKRKIKPRKKVGLPRKKLGKGLFDSILKAVPFIRDTKLISKGADALGIPIVGNIASALGFGRAPKRVVRKPRRAQGAPKPNPARRAQGAPRRAKVGGVIFHSLPYKENLTMRALGGGRKRHPRKRKGGSWMGPVASALGLVNGIRGNDLASLSRL